jgi:hypothetical protein
MEFNPRRNSIGQGLPSSDILLLKVHQTLGRVDQRFGCPDHLLTGGNGGTTWDRIGWHERIYEMEKTYEYYLR